MSFIKEILRMNDELHLSQREITKATGKSREALSNVLKMSKAQNINFNSSAYLKDDELKNLIYPNNNPYRDVPDPDLD